MDRISEYLSFLSSILYHHRKRTIKTTRANGGRAEVTDNTVPTFQTMLWDGPFGVGGDKYELTSC